ncbi:hypothetical protein [Methyloceanibacter methanicus]|uniref:hypothetical protein n=1 Tax=Methyloceanibacter methanicus TaxID=1774968 RepID=UPI001FCD3753|nr:hypothetical protein [Methyloceanibacter methanicus]
MARPVAFDALPVVPVEDTKESRAVVLALALTELLARSGERIGLMGECHPRAAM